MEFEITDGKIITPTYMNIDLSSDLKSYNSSKEFMEINENDENGRMCTK